MRKTSPIALALLGSIWLSCQSDSAKTKNQKPAEKERPKIDLMAGSTPRAFNAKTTTGVWFNSASNKGKYWVIFVYDNRYLKPRSDYSLPAELNATYEKFKNDVDFVGIINGNLDNHQELGKLLAIAQIKFKQIDNTDSFERQAQINENIFCTPAKLLISPEGKVLYNGCGGHSDYLDFKLDSLKRHKKL